MRVSVPDESWRDALSDLDVEVVLWDGASAQPEGRLDLAVWPYTLDSRDLAAVDASRIGLIQGQSLGYDGVAEALPAGACAEVAPSLPESVLQVGPRCSLRGRDAEE